MPTSTVGKYDWLLDVPFAGPARVKRKREEILQKFGEL